MSKSAKRRAHISISSSNEGSRAAPATGTPVGCCGEAVPVGQWVKDNDLAPPPAGEALRALSARIVELLSMVTVLVGQLACRGGGLGWIPTRRGQPGAPRVFSGLRIGELEPAWESQRRTTTGPAGGDLPSAMAGPRYLSDVAYRGTSPGAAVLL
ncbi:unnamed protein product [Lampetra planeri]